MATWNTLTPARRKEIVDGYLHKWFTFHGTARNCGTTSTTVKRVLKEAGVIK